LSLGDKPTLYYWYWERVRKKGHGITKGKEEGEVEGKKKNKRKNSWAKSQGGGWPRGCRTVEIWGRGKKEMASEKKKKIVSQKKGGLKIIKRGGD